jgi:hypothetical protein
VDDLSANAFDCTASANREPLAWYLNWWTDETYPADYDSDEGVSAFGTISRLADFSNTTQREPMNGKSDGKSSEAMA